MNTSTTHRLSALFASVVITFTILSMIDTLAQPAPVATQLAARSA